MCDALVPSTRHASLVVDRGAAPAQSPRSDRAGNTLYQGCVFRVGIWERVSGVGINGCPPLHVARATSGCSRTRVRSALPYSARPRCCGPARYESQLGAPCAAFNARTGVAPERDARRCVTRDRRGAGSAMLSVVRLNARTGVAPERGARRCETLWCRRRGVPLWSSTEALRRHGPLGATMLAAPCTKGACFARRVVAKD